MVLRFDPQGGMEAGAAAVVAMGLDLSDPLHAGESRAAAESGVAIDMYREGDHYILHADLPGLDPGSLSLTVEGRLLTIRGHRTLRDFAGAKWVLRDRRRGLVERQILLGNDVLVSGISTQYACGVLNVMLPVNPSHRRRKIAVRYDSGESAPS